MLAGCMLPPQPPPCAVNTGSFVLLPTRRAQLMARQWRRRAKGDIEAKESDQDGLARLLNVAYVTCVSTEHCLRTRQSVSAARCRTVHADLWPCQQHNLCAPQRPLASWFLGLQMASLAPAAAAAAVAAAAASAGPMPECSGLIHLLAPAHPSAQPHIHACAHALVH